MAVLLQVKVRRRALATQPVGCAPALSLTQKRCCSSSIITIIITNEEIKVTLSRKRCRGTLQVYGLWCYITVIVHVINMQVSLVVS